MYQIEVLPVPTKQLKKLVKSDPQLKQRIEKALDLLSANPNHVGLKTHKVNTRNYGTHFSSRITGDLRLIWNYYQEKIIVVLAIADHSDYN